MKHIKARNSRILGPISAKRARKGEAVTEVNLDQAEHHPFLSYPEIKEKQALKLRA